MLVVSSFYALGNKLKLHKGDWSFQLTTSSHGDLRQHCLCKVRELVWWHIHVVHSRGDGCIWPELRRRSPLNSYLHSMHTFCFTL